MAPKYAVCVSDGYVCSPTDDHDAEFITALRNAAPKLFERVRELQTEIEEIGNDACDACLGERDSLRACIAELEARLARYEGDDE